MQINCAIYARVIYDDNIEHALFLVIEFRMMHWFNGGRISFPQIAHVTKSQWKLMDCC